MRLVFAPICEYRFISVKIISVVIKVLLNDCGVCITLADILKASMIEIGDSSQGGRELGIVKILKSW